MTTGRKAIWDSLASELEKLGENEMAEKARAGYYSDFASPLATPKIALNNELIAKRHYDLAQDVRDGVFDG